MHEGTQNAAESRTKEAREKKSKGLGVLYTSDTMGEIKKHAPQSPPGAALA